MCLSHCPQYSDNLSSHVPPRSIANEVLTIAREFSEYSAPGMLEIPDPAQERCLSNKEPAMPYKDNEECSFPNLDTVHGPNVRLEVQHKESEPELYNEEWDSGEHDFSELLTQSRAYKWLLAKLRRDLQLADPSETVGGLSEAIFRELDENQLFRPESAPQCVDAVFQANWSPHSFFEDQEYGIPPEEGVVKALVLVGTTTQAEGLACGDYLSRQWPESAQVFMKLVQSVVRSAKGTSHDGTLQFYLHGTCLTLT